MALVYTDQFLHRRYAQPGKIECLAVHDKVVLDMFAKGRHSGSGKTFHEPVRVSNPQGLSATRAGAQLVAEGGHAGATSVVGEWSLPYGDYAGSVQITDKDIDAGGDVPDGSYLKPLGLETDGIIEELGEVMDTYIFSEPGKAVGVYSGSAIAAGVLTLTGGAAGAQLMNFKPRGPVQVSANDGSGAHSLLGSWSLCWVSVVGGTSY